MGSRDISGVYAADLAKGSDYERFEGGFRGPGFRDDGGVGGVCDAGGDGSA